MRLDELKYEFEQVNRRLDQQNHELQAYNASLREHMGRTELLEHSVAAQREHFEYRHDATEERMERQEAAFNGLPRKALEIVSIIAGLIGLIKILF